MIIQGERGRQDHFHYEFDRNSPPIGVGGMGVVYSGTLVNELTGSVRKVAVKEVVADADAAKRKAIIEQAEREASIRMMNDNLVEMIDFVEVEEVKFGSVKKRYYVISELLHGVTLDKVLEEQFYDKEGKVIPYAEELSRRYKIDREDTAYMIIRNVLSGIMALHDKGYLHRDIDPSNIMITDDGKIKILDYGIAKQCKSLSAEDGLQEEGAFVGKVEYAAPELISGDVESQDFSTDIYEIGVLFYRLVCGRLPFEGNRFEIMKGHLHKKPDLSGIKDAKCRAILSKSLQKNPNKRYRTSAEMRVALDSAKPMPKWGWPVLVGALLAVVLVVIILLIDKMKPVDQEEQHHGSEDIVVIEPEQDTLNVTELLETPSPISLLADNPDNPALLLAASRNRQALMELSEDKTVNEKGPAHLFWYDVLIPSGDVNQYLNIDLDANDGKSYSSNRFAFVALSRALKCIDKYKYSPGVREALEQNIKAEIEKVRRVVKDELRAETQDTF